jgi:hypothetical protein
MPQKDKSPLKRTSRHLFTGFSDTPAADRRDGPDLGGGRLITSATLIGAGVLVEPEFLGGAPAVPITITEQIASAPILGKRRRASGRS